MLGIDIANMAATTFLLVANPLQCMVPKAPVININPVTEKVRYDYSKKSAELSAMKNDTVSPYAPGVDISTGGLRKDAPQTQLSISWGYREYPRLNAICLWYDKIDIKVTLSPVVYIAKEYNKRGCKEKILKHEMRHVNVDHIVVNEYAQELGVAVQNAVNSAGALGPYPTSQLDKARDSIKRHVEKAVESKSAMLSNRMRELQREVDSLEEYERISKHCNHIKIKK